MIRLDFSMTSCCSIIETHLFLCLQGLRANLGKRSAAEVIHIILERKFSNDRLINNNRQKAVA